MAAVTGGADGAGVALSVERLVVAAMAKRCGAHLRRLCDALGASAAARLDPDPDPDAMAVDGAPADAAAPADARCRGS